MNYEDFMGDDVRRPDYLLNEKGFKADNPYFVDVICDKYDYGNPYQVGVGCSEECGMLSCNKSIEEIDTSFWIEYIKHQVEDKHRFLKYHLVCFIESGGKKNAFFHWLKKGFKIFEKNEKCWKEYIEEDLLIFDKEYLYKWIDEVELKNDLRNDIHENENIQPPTDLVSEEKRQTHIDIKPTFKPEIVLTVYDILKSFFSNEQQSQLKEILMTGNDVSEHLIFKDSGNRLTDVFKKLKEKDFIVSCQKKDLEKWISKNFKFMFRNEVKVFSEDYLEKCISRDEFHCKRPLLNISNGRIIEVN